MRSTPRLPGLLAALMFCGALAGAAGTACAKPPAPPTRAAVEEVRCPVMGAVVRDPDSALKSEYKGRTYYFCCPGCKPMFDADPEKYVGGQAPGKPAQPPAPSQGGGHRGH